MAMRETTEGKVKWKGSRNLPRVGSFRNCSIDWISLQEMMILCSVLSHLRTEFNRLWLQGMGNPNCKKSMTSLSVWVLDSCPRKSMLEFKDKGKWHSWKFGDPDSWTVSCMYEYQSWSKTSGTLKTQAAHQIWQPLTDCGACNTWELGLDKHAQNAQEQVSSPIQKRTLLSQPSSLTSSQLVLWGPTAFLFVPRVTSCTKMYHRNRPATRENIIMQGLLSQEWD